MFAENACLFCAIVMCTSKAFGDNNVNNHCLSNNLPLLRIFEASIMQSLAFIADVFAVASVATKASNVAMSGNYEEAKRIIETL